MPAPKPPSRLFRRKQKERPRTPPVTFLMPFLLCARANLAVARLQVPSNYA